MCNRRVSYPVKGIAMFKRLKIFQFDYDYRGTKTTEIVLAYTFEEAVQYLTVFVYEAYVKGDVSYSSYDAHTGTKIVITH